MSQEYYREILMQSPVGYAFHKIVKSEESSLTDFEIYEVNYAFEKIAGLKAQDLYGKKLSVLAQSDSSGQMRLLFGIYQKLIKSGYYGEIESVSGNNGRWYSVYASSYKEDVFVVRLQDITVRKKMEKVLKENEKKFRSIFDNATSAIFITDVDSEIIVDVNAYAIKLIEYSKDELIGTKQNDLYIKSDGEKLVGRFAEVLESHDFYEAYIKTKTGKVMTVRVETGEIFVIENRKLVACMFQDISPQKAYEEELELAKERAENASKAKSEFLATMSHEIRTPLNGVIGFIDLLYNSKLSSTQKQYAQIANTSAYLLLNMINDVLDFSRIEAGKLEIEETWSDVHEMMEQVVDVVKYTAQDKGLELVLNITNDVPKYMIVDAVRIKQVLVNLVGNAVKFTDEGEVLLTLDFKPISGNSGTFMFSVKDTGIGISDEYQEKIFTAFIQADMSVMRKYGGTGLGLNISQSILRKMAVDLRLYSKIGKGSEFYFELERGFEHADVAHIESIPDIERVLLVEDNESNSQVLKRSLESWGIEVVAVPNGLETLKVLESDRDFDALLIDYGMPYLSGIETMRIIKEKFGAQVIGQRQMALMYSFSDDVNLHDECEKLGVVNKLVKPIKLCELRSCFNSIASTIDSISHSALSEISIIADISTDIKVLIVDDVFMNRLVTKSLVNVFLPNAMVVEANDGDEGVKKFAEYAPDIVFMDIQMPIMDGYRATQEIRKLEHAKITKTPIIALTARVIKGEQEKCISAGMDYYLTKPVERQAFREVFMRCVNNISGNETALVQKKSDCKDYLSADETEEGCFFDRNELMERISGDEELFIELRELFLSNVMEEIEKMESLFELKNMAEISKLGHKIKGRALTMSCRRMAAVAEEIEDMDVIDSAVLQKLIVQLKCDFESTKKELSG